MKTKVDGKDVQNNSWYNPHVIEGEINEEASMTVPNQALSVRKILEKHVNGMRVGVMKQGIYHEDQNIDNPVIERLIDVTEVEENVRLVNENLAGYAAAKKTVVKTETETTETANEK